MNTLGEQIIVRGITASRIPDKFGNTWQYHSRSDRHSKIACWAILFDLLRSCPLLRAHAAAGKIFFGINHELTDFRVNRSKNLDLVLCTGAADGAEGFDFSVYAKELGLPLNDAERAELATLPALKLGKPTNVVLALEAKACMTEHIKARPRLYDELASSYQTIHGDTVSAIAGAFVMVNGAEKFLSTDRNKHRLKPKSAVWTPHTQPRVAEAVLQKLRELPRRSDEKSPGFDALGIVIVSCLNDGSPVSVEPALSAKVDPILRYEALVQRLTHLYATKFSAL